MGPEANWLDLLKANGWQFGCLAVAAWLAVVGDKLGWLPVALDPSWKQGTMLGAFALTALWVASVGSTASKWSAVPIAKLKDRIALRGHAKEFREYIPFMTARERQIFAQLLHENRKTFTGADDGGYASTLIGRGFVVVMVRRGQPISFEDVPDAVPDHIWKELEPRRADFPYKPSKDGADAWRVHWMAR